MKFKEKMNQAAGFTLVELIVVIAILAILAGVAVPAYSGYINKANQQSDISLVSDIKQALTLAYYSGDLNDANGYIVLSTEGVVNADEIVSNSPVDTAMTSAFGSNWKSSLALKYGEWGGVIFDMDEDTAKLVLNSSYLTGSNAEELMGTVSSLTNAITGVIDGKPDKEAALTSILSKLYDDSDTATDGELADLAKDSFGVTDLTALDSNQMANLLLMSAASEVSNCTDEEIKTYLGGLMEGNIETELNGLTQLVIMYSCLSGYACSDYASETDKDAYATLTNELSNLSGDNVTMQAMGAMLNTMNDLMATSGQQLDKYVDNSTIYSDLDAFKSMMTALSSGSTNLTVDDLADANLATTGALGEHLQTYVASAQAVASGVDLSVLNAAMSKGEVAIVFFLKDGQFTVFSTLQS